MGVASIGSNKLLKLISIMVAMILDIYTLPFHNIIILSQAKMIRNVAQRKNLFCEKFYVVQLGSRAELWNMQR